MSKKTYAELLAAAGNARPLKLAVAVSVKRPPYDPSILLPAIQVKLAALNGMQTMIGTSPGDVPLHQQLHYRNLDDPSRDYLRQMKIEPDSPIPFRLDYLWLFQAGRRLLHPTQDRVNRFYSWLIHLLLVEIQLQICVQYYTGLGFEKESVPATFWMEAMGLMPDEYVLSQLNSVVINELHGRIFFEYALVMIRAQWDKLIGLTCYVLEEKEHWKSISDGINLLQRCIDNNDHDYSSVCIAHLKLLVSVARAKTDNDSWLKRNRDALMHQVGGHSAGVLPHKKSTLTTGELWQQVRDEHEWLREAIMTAIIVWATATLRPLTESPD